MPPAGQNVHVVAPGESLIGLARNNNMSLSALARANNHRAAHQAQCRRPHHHSGWRASDRGRASCAVDDNSGAVNGRRAAAGGAAAHRSGRKGRKRSGADRASGDAVNRRPPKPRRRGAEAAGAVPSFRWPVQGRVIAAFGPKPNGGQNDGINLAVPEGTPIKAAEDGVVAYAGNELKGYGNLVLIRHANGYVSAYANAKELLVKRGDSIKRGQVIANAGQTGNVTSPQLHFEIRKGSTPVDPTKFLTGGGGLIVDQSSFNVTPRRPASSWMNCQATRPEREPRVVAHSSASRRNSSRHRPSGCDS